MKRYFEWDSKKSASNLRKHGVAFEDAVLVFSDPLGASSPERIEHGEERWQSVGLCKGVLLYVAHTVAIDEDEPAEIIRIISARRATTVERKRYEHG